MTSKRLRPVSVQENWMLRTLQGFDEDDKNKIGRLSNPDRDLTDYLAGLGVNYFRARDAARKYTFDEFAEVFDILSSEIGEENAKKIVKYGNVIEYSNSSLDAYLKLVRQAAGKKGHNLDTKSVTHFYSIDSLNSFLFPKNTAVETRPTGLDLGKYRILRQEDPIARVYLGKLVEGELTVGGKEHWNTGRMNDGLRGAHIILEIKKQLIHACAEAGLGSPHIVNSRMNTLSVSQEGMEVLERLRSLAYGES